MRQLHQKNRRRWAAGAMLASSVGLGGMYQAQTAADAAGGVAAGPNGLLPTTTKASLHALNNSGVTGRSTVTVDGRQITVDVTASHLLKRMPHAMHVHVSRHADHNFPGVNPCGRSARVNSCVHATIA